MRIDPVSRTVVTTVPVGNGPTGIAFGAGAVWVANSLDGTVMRIDPDTNTVTATTDLAFRVAVQDSGSFQEFDIKVTLTIARTQGQKPITRTKTIDIINAGETKTVVFSDLGAPPFGVPTTVKVDVQPVPGEKTTSNNSAEYRVIFSLG